MYINCVKGSLNQGFLLPFNAWRALCTKSVLCEVQIVEHLPSRVFKNLMCDNISGRAAMNGQLGCGSLRQCDLFW